MILMTVVLLNIFAVPIYGEAEFWSASIKIIAILGLIILGTVLFFGGGPNHDRLGFRYWKDPGAFNSYPKPGLGHTGKFLAFWTALIRSGFAFILSPETIAITAGESEAPRRNIPRTSKRSVYLLIVFYVLGTLVVSVIVASNDTDLLQAVSSGTKNAGASPFVVGIKRAGIQSLDHVINAVILTSAWGSANSFLYAGSRSLLSLAMSGQAPEIFARCSNGVPYNAVLATAALGCLAYLSVSSGSATVFAWFLNLTTIGGYVAWVVMLMTYLVSFLSSNLPGCTDRDFSALPKRPRPQQHAFLDPVQKSLATIYELLCHGDAGPAVLNQRLPSLLPRQFFRQVFSSSIHHSTSVLYSLFRT